MSELPTQPAKYPAPLRLLHWLMAAIVIGMLGAGLLMVVLPDEMPAKFELLYPYHKSFGMLVLLLVAVRLIVRSATRAPELPKELARWEIAAAKVAHVALYALMIVVPLMGYSMSSSFTQSDGVFFFGVFLPELLPKNDANFEVFQLLHRILAYCLLGLIAIHVGAALKHRLLDRSKDADVLARML